jgi:hypothetical protein
VDEPDQGTDLAWIGFEWPCYPRILIAVDETPAAAFALRHVVQYAVADRRRTPGARGGNTPQVGR